MTVDRGGWSNRCTEPALQLAGDTCTIITMTDESALSAISSLGWCHWVGSLGWGHCGWLGPLRPSAQCFQVSALEAGKKCRGVDWVRSVLGSTSVVSFRVTVRIGPSACVRVHVRLIHP
jgi:hypothetical protein